MSKGPPIKKIYLAVFVIALIGFIWLNQGLSYEELEEAFKDTIQTLKINNVTIGEIYLPQQANLWAGGANIADIYRDGIERYNKIGINVTLHNPSEYRLKIRLESFDVLWVTSLGYTCSLGGINARIGFQNQKIILIESGETKTFVIDGLGFEGDCINYLRSKIKTPEFLFDGYMDVTASASSGKAISYILEHNFDGSIRSEDYYYT